MISTWYSIRLKIQSCRLTCSFPHNLNPAEDRASCDVRETICNDSINKANLIKCNLKIQNSKWKVFLFCTGGIYALVAAHLASLILNWKEDAAILQERFRKSVKDSAVHFHGKAVRTIRLGTFFHFKKQDCAQDCTRLHKTAQGCTRLHKTAQDCTRLHKTAQACR